MNAPITIMFHEMKENGLITHNYWYFQIVLNGYKSYKLIHLLIHVFNLKRSLIKELKNTNIYNNAVAACEKSIKYELPLIL